MSENARIRRTAVITGCAIALGSLMSACGSTTSSTAAPANTATTLHGTAPIPSTTGATSTANVATTTASAATPSTTRSSPSPASPPSGAPTPVAADFLPQSSLPDWPAYGWTKPRFTEVDVEHPLPGTCDDSSGPQATRGVSEADYASRDSDVYAVENIYTYV